MVRFTKIREVVKINNREEITVNDQVYLLRPASESEAGVFYALTPERDEQLAAIGHVRMDFGSSGREFWHTWQPRGDEALNSPDFKSELCQVVDELRKTVLKDLRGMKRFCRDHGGEISGGYRQNYGYVLDTAHYRYCLRCNPQPGDYQGNLTCFDLDQQRLNLMQATRPDMVGMTFYGDGNATAFTEAEDFLAAVRERLDSEDNGFRYLTATDDPRLQEALTEMEQTLGQGMSMGGM